ncbi:class I SAM-dependent methyltransferase [Pseudomonas phytophila]|uniref:Class I SAM-dependent methyltransferase n=1 Tax=Pseudomonas phytophila TaxID=2867264 RepID=A0ABY6FCV9_9PSED|nr:class I SAM-dependent methyltransferase [Pseudomonas phytophila]UXZ95717.1 class I SAM-dependent methyltransferase [Pseudomonas phytophila]
MSADQYAGELKQLAMHPDYIAYPLSWLGHIPFAAWLVTVVEPRQFVELGSYSGTSYFAFCQAIKNAALDTRCFAIDTWEGDEHTGSYSDAIFQAFTEYNETHFSEFSSCLRMRFDDALPKVGYCSVDLLHIDGLHTYEAVKNDYETWMPKMSERGVILFHDTVVDIDGFGVIRFWSEVCDLFPSYNFTHSNGLGVLLVGSLYQQDDALLKAIKSVALLGERLAERLWLQQIVSEKHGELEKLQAVTIPGMIAEKKQSDAARHYLEQAVIEQQLKLEVLETVTTPAMLAEKEQLDAALRRADAELASSNSELKKIKDSTVWKVLTKISSIKNAIF